MLQYAAILNYLPRSIHGSSFHISIFQEGDPVAGNTPRFLARHITVRYLLMMDDLRIIDNGEFKTHESFRDYNDSVGVLSHEDYTIA